jgi:hypothetical protein
MSIFSLIKFQPTKSEARKKLTMASQQLHRPRINQGKKSKEKNKRL